MGRSSGAGRRGRRAESEAHSQKVLGAGAAGVHITVGVPQGRAKDVPPWTARTKRPIDANVG
ncbi:hypothetical protein GCM10007977_008900 [Dactylosporangium sucinum]|uniref:Uncharacterized protein n=1 Tax=Dactylosporangium sucinum TaxID=1424081 RepID=A0A917T5N8_9ACTN|nr:hypothetical protein GCM10007977_008900 [Dactylosporangium sucinum]